MEDGRAHPRPLAMSKPAVPRAATRHKTFEPTTLATAGGDLRAHILNLSATGALLHAAGLARGDRCTILLAGRAVAAEVMWVDGARAGVAFRIALGSDDLARLLG